MAVEHIANIGPRGAKRRAMGGAFWSVVTVVAFVALAITHAAPSIRALTAVPVFLAAVGFLQAREKT